MKQEIGRRAFLTATGAAVTTAALATPAFATDDARDAATATEHVDVQLLSITDLHGYLNESSVITGAAGRTYQVGGVGYLATHLERLRDGHQNSIFFAPGDMFSGWPMEALSVADESTIEVLNRIGLQFTSVGNHELDKSPMFLTDHMEHGVPLSEVGWDDEFPQSTGARFPGADFRYYAANIVWSENGRTLVPPYNVEWVDAGGGRRLPIGFIHLTAIGAELMNCSIQPALRTLDEIATVNKYAAHLRAKGVNAIVVCMHDGASAGLDFNSGSDPFGPAYDLARAVTPHVDAIVTGHWHSRFNMMVPDPDGVPRPFVEAGYNGQLINEINLRLDRRTGKVVRELTVSTNHANTRDVPQDPDVQGIAAYWTAVTTSRGKTAIGTQTGSFTRSRNAAGESTVGDLAADWALWCGRQPADPTNNGNNHHAGLAQLAMIAIAPSIGRPVVQGDLAYQTPPGQPAGTITLAHAWNAIGFGDPIVTATVTGRQIHDALEQQWTVDSKHKVTYAPFAVSHNVHVAFDASRPAGDRVDPADVRIDGHPLDLTRKYRLATIAYTWVGDNGYPALAKYAKPVRYIRDYESFTRYIRAQKVLAPTPLDRITTRTATAFVGEVQPEPAPLMMDGRYLSRTETALLARQSTGPHRIPC